MPQGFFPHKEAYKTLRSFWAKDRGRTFSPVLL